MTVLHEISYSLAPLYIHYKTLEWQYQKEISKMFEVDVPVIILSSTTEK